MKRALPLLVLCGLFGFAPAAAPPRGYYRFPAISGETIVFTAEGDLWRVGLAGGVAQRLTSHPSDETNAALSPDGATVAFTASYEGPAEVYTMPVAGGLPTRRTWEGGATVVGWTPDGQVLYRTNAYSTLPSAQLVRIDTATGTRRVVPLAQASDGSYDGTTLYFTRLPFQGSHTKRYQGGTAQNIWRFAASAPEAAPLTANYAGTSKTPMWWQGRVYFASDRDGTMNLWSMAPDGSDVKQLTRHQGWDVQAPALAQGKIVYELGADLHLFDIASGQDRELPITLATDLDQTRERWVTAPIEWLTAAHASSNGDRVVLTARGQVFVAPVGPGRLVEASRRPGVRYRSARFAPDGKSLFVLSDQTGETDWWRLPANGVGAAEQITTDAQVLRFDGSPSPDGQWIAYGDKDQQLWLVNVAQKKTTRIATSPEGGYGDLAWSPDSKWLAYVEPSATFSPIMLYSIADGRATRVTSERVDNYSPAFSPDGKWLYFLSDRNFQSLVGGPWGPRQPEPFFDRQTKIYQVALQPGLRSPFQPADELQPAATDTSKARVDLAGVMGRLSEVPVPAGNYGDLAANGTRLFWLSRETTPEGRLKLQALDIGNKPGTEPITLVEDVRAYELTGDGKKILLRKGDELHVIEAGSAAGVSLGPKTRVDLAAWSFSFDPREEWRQMFTEAWRLERDYFYDRRMHSVDWPAMLRKYQPLVERVTDRGELSNLLAQMVGELSALHIFVNGGDFRRGREQIADGSLGAALTRDEGAGGYRVSHIYRSDPDYPEQLSPLARPSVDVREGDVIQMINGVGTLTVPDPAQLLRSRAGRQVLVRVKPASAAPARDVIVTPITAGRANGLRYDEWEYTRRLAVDSLGQGRIGYLHLRAMGSGDIAQWAREFYPVFNRQGLIIDVRNNNGGNIDSWILEKLMRKAWMYWQPRVGNPYWNMQWAFRGHMVVLANEGTASDGEAFAEGFRRLGLGKVIGTRSWGGEIWLTSSNVLVDRGIATAAEFGVYGPEGAWLIEGHGVDPDSVVDNLPHATFQGEDAQLRAAIGYLERQIREHPVPVPPAPAYPNKAGPRP